MLTGLIYSIIPGWTRREKALTTYSEGRPVTRARVLNSYIFFTFRRICFSVLLQDFALKKLIFVSRGCTQDLQT